MAAGSAPEFAFECQLTYDGFDLVLKYPPVSQFALPKPAAGSRFE